jgi:tetratricopeptide (TPR) repeat protein
MSFGQDNFLHPTGGVTFLSSTGTIIGGYAKKPLSCHVRAMSKTGRNDPCPCGSGKKFKHCCGLREETPAVKPARNLSLANALNAALEHHHAGRLNDAEALYRQILSTAPDHPDALYLLGMIAYEVGKNGAAVELVGRALSLNPRFVEGHNNIGLALHRMERYAEAAGHFRAALALRPDYADAHSNLGLTLHAQGRPVDAVGHYRTALALKPDPETHNNLGNALKEQGEPIDAIEHYRAALALKPEFTEAHHNLGIILNWLNRLDALLADSGDDVAPLPGHAAARPGRELGMAPHAPNSMSKAVSETVLEGIKHHRAGRLARAETLYQHARQIIPEHPDLLHLLGRIAHERGRDDLALELVGRAARARPSEPMYAASLERVRRPDFAARPEYAATPEIEIVSATRMTEREFWDQSALGISLRGLARDARLAANIAFENRRNLPEIFNERMGGAADDQILVFVHDDVWIDDFFFAERLVRGLASYDVVGVAGNRRRVPNQPGWVHTAYADGKLAREDGANLHGGIAHGERPFGASAAFGESLAGECELMDGVFLAARKSALLAAKVQFDPRFDFHFYDMDFCRSARKNGLRLGAWPLFLTHQSEGAFKSAGWEKMYRVYLEKWQS